jgi:general secretion pathway protein D
MTPFRLRFVSMTVGLLVGCGPTPVRVSPPGHTAAPPVTETAKLGATEPPEPAPSSTAIPKTTYQGTGRLFNSPNAAAAETALPDTPPALPGNGVQLAFTDADINQVVATILGEALGFNYSIDPAVKGTISLHSTRPLTSEELLPALEAALRIQEYALVNVRGTYHVVPIKDASHRVSSLSLPADRKAAGFSIQVVPLEFTSATEMEKILIPFAPAGGVMKVDEARDLLLLAGTSQELGTMLDVVKTFDVDWLAGMSYRFYNLNYVDAKTAVSELSEIFSEPKSPLAGVVRLVPLTRLNTILVITPQPRYLQSVETWIKRLDIGGTSAGRRIYVYDVQNGRAEDLARSLNKILSLSTSGDEGAQSQPGFGTSVGPSGYGSGFGSGLNSSPASSLGSTGGYSPSSMGGSGGSTFGSLASPAQSALPPSSFGSSGNSAKQGDLRIVANNDSNSLLVLATPAEFSVIEVALLRLDTPSRQVLIEASLAEVTLTDELRYGVQWNYNGKKGPVTLSDSANGKISQKFPGLSYLFTGSTDISAVLNALESVTKVRVISSPKLVTLNNHTAQLQVGDEVPVTTQSAISVGTAGAPIVNSVQLRDTGVILQVTPRVNKNGLVQLDISQEVSNSIPTTTSSIDSPTIQQRKLSSTVVVKNGDTVALGGLITENITKAKSGVPYLAKIPVLGAIFRDTNNTSTRTELILLITPRVMRDDNEFQDVMDDLRLQFQSLKGVFANPQPKK